MSPITNQEMLGLASISEICKDRPPRQASRQVHLSGEGPGKGSRYRANLPLVYTFRDDIAFISSAELIGVTEPANALLLDTVYKDEARATA